MAPPVRLPRPSGGAAAERRHGSAVPRTATVACRPPNTYRVVLMGNCHPLHQARDDLCREEVVAVAGDRDNAML